MILTALLTALASALHGRGGERISKGMIVAGHAITLLLTGYVIDSFIGAAVGLCGAALFWGLARRSYQAQAEMDTMQAITLRNVVRCIYTYIPFYLITALYSGEYWLLLYILTSPIIALIMSYRIMGIPDDGGGTNRRITEGITGLSCGIAMGAMM